MRAAAPAALIALAATACSGPPPPRHADAAASLPAFSYAAPELEHRVRALRTGDVNARRIIFIHGTPGSAGAWVDYLAEPLAGFDSIAVDRPGFGGSGDEPVASLAAQAAAIAPLLVERDGRWPILVGHSLGAPIAAQAAADNPGKVGALVLLAGSLDPAQERILWVQHMARWPLVRDLVPQALATTNAEIMALKPQLDALAPRLRRLACPIVIVHGTRDRLVPFANVGFMRAQFSAADMHVVTLADTDHFLPWSNEADVRRAVLHAAAMDGPPC